MVTFLPGARLLVFRDSEKAGTWQEFVAEFDSPELQTLRPELVTVNLDVLPFHFHSFSIRRSIAGRFEYRRRNPASFCWKPPRSPACA